MSTAKLSKSPPAAESEKRLGPYLQASRMRKGLTQKSVGLALGYQTAQFVSEWERGVRSPPASVLRKLVEIYEISIDEFYEVLRAERVIRIEEELKRELFDKV